MVEETFLPGNSVSRVACMHGVAPNQLFGWGWQAASGVLTATRAGGEVVPVNEYRALRSRGNGLRCHHRRHIRGGRARSHDRHRRASLWPCEQA